MTPATRATALDALRAALDQCRQDIRMDWERYLKPYEWRRRTIAARNILRLRSAIRELTLNDEVEVLWQRAGYSSSIEVWQAEKR